MPSEVTLVLLVGGRGRRMGGADKARLPLGRRTFTEEIAARLGPLFSEILLVGADPGAYGDLGFRSIPDLHPGAGPLAGIAAGLEAARFPQAFVCACDMPRVEADVAARIVSLLGDHDAAVCRVEGRPQPLFAAWSRRCTREAEHLAAAGGAPVMRLLDRVDCRWLSEADFEGIPLWAESFANVNTPEDLAAVEDRSQGPLPEPGPDLLK